MGIANTPYWWNSDVKKYGWFTLTLRLWNDATSIQKLVANQPYYWTLVKEDGTEEKTTKYIEGFNTSTLSYSFDRVRLQVGNYILKSDSGEVLAQYDDNTGLFNTMTIVEGNTSKSNVALYTVWNPACVLYRDGTFIINELPEDRDANIALHGQVRKQYPGYTSQYGWWKPWVNDTANAERVKEVYIGSPTKPATVALLFKGFKNCEKIDLTGLDTRDVEIYRQMFDDCWSLYDCNLEVLNTRSATAMDSMFRACRSWANLNVDTFDTSNVVNMAGMFMGCGATYLAPMIDTSKVTNMNSMFAYCTNVEEIDISNFDISSLQYCSQMFGQSRKLKTIWAKDTLDFVDVPYAGLNNMFSNCESLVGGAGTAWTNSNLDKYYAHVDMYNGKPGYFSSYISDRNYTTLYADGTLIINELGTDRPGNIAMHGSVVKGYPALSYSTPYVFRGPTQVYWWNEYRDIKHITFGEMVRPADMSYWFYNLKYLEDIQMINLDTSAVLRYVGTFAYVQGANVDWSKIITDNATTTKMMFMGSSWADLPIDHFNTSNVKDMSQMFMSCVMREIDINSWDTSKVETMNQMFRLSYFKTMNVKSWNVRQCLDFTQCFAEMFYLTELEINWDTFNATKLALMFNNTHELTQLKSPRLDGINCEDLHMMFADCRKLESIDFSNFNNNNCRNTHAMFDNCQKLKELVFPRFGVQVVTDGAYMFRNCYELTTIKVKANAWWNTDVMTNSTDMFLSCTSLVGGNGTTYSPMFTDKRRCWVDGVDEKQGYLTLI